MTRPNRPPPERTATVRTRIREALADGHSVTLKELSGLVGVSERDLPGHLEHLAKSVEADGRTLVLEPARCIACGFTFEGRQRFTRPGKCPDCRGSRISPPRVHLD